MSENITNPLNVPRAFQVIQRFCRLQDRVATEIVGYQYAADCFCGQGGFWPLEDAEDYRNDEKALEWIEEAVEQRIRREAGKFSDGAHS